MSSQKKSLPDLNVISKELKKNLHVLENTFSANNLQILNIGCEISEIFSLYHVNFYIELATIEGTQINYDCQAKINFYNEDGDLCKICTSNDIDKDKFLGYDTVALYFSGSIDTISSISKARLYISKQ